MNFYLFRKIILFFRKNSQVSLIKDLEKEHKELVKLYQQIETKFNKRNIEDVIKLLNKFFYKYKKHVLFEDNYLYDKLIKKYDGYESILNFINETKEEMNKITKMLEKFLLIYSTKETIKNKKNEFFHDYKKLGKALKERIEFEETKLYVLY